MHKNVVGIDFPQTVCSGDGNEDHDDIQGIDIFVDERYNEEEFDGDRLVIAARRSHGPRSNVWIDIHPNAIGRLLEVIASQWKDHLSEHERAAVISALMP